MLIYASNMVMQCWLIVIDSDFSMISMNNTWTSEAPKMVDVVIKTKH